ncbi:hypothetical protein Pla108_31190 [Botrimarina colliarenosi]|uniref:DUF485 domain-containing protein n=1 Tax=Botrimarina colliarenosi TaxID=2528001 RepID=A0A5C6A9K8_9BACT|nr:DUF485 domain-containing protein [Botrimarina colliarenosi]TWT96037.1 hypothetical protein Pla108_31190 [Botrimarina colliarenosi]
MAGRNARLGLVLFTVYAVFYAAFVLVNAFAADWMDAKPLAGLNAAVLSGFGLIVLALVLALFYGVTASSAPSDMQNGEGR